MRHSTLSFLFLGALLTTAFTLQWWQLPVYPRWLWVLLGLTACHAFVFPRARAPIFALSLGVAVALLAVMRVTTIPTPETIDWYTTKQKVTITGVISDEPDRRPMQTKYTVSVKSLTTENGEIKVSGKVLVSDRSGWPLFYYGDGISVRGTLEKPEPIEDFHYDLYLKRYGITGLISFADITRLSSGGNPLFAGLYTLKDRFEGQINRLYPEPHASFLAGLLTGSRKGIPEALTEDFRRVGLSHIIAISGYNMTIVVVVMTALTLWLPLQWRLVPAIIGIWVFTIFVGASAAVVRAALMGSLGLVALHLGRKQNARLLILWTLGVLTVWNPLQLWYDAGFQLSFAAVFGLTEIGPHIRPLFRWLPEKLGVRDAVQMTVAAEIATLPLLAMHFGEVSLVAPVTNLLAAPAIPLAMLLGFSSVIVSVLTFPLGQCVAYITWVTLEWIVLIAQIFALVPGASVTVSPLFSFLITGATVAIILFKLFWAPSDTHTRSSSRRSPSPETSLSGFVPGTGKNSKRRQSRAVVPGRISPQISA